MAWCPRCEENHTIIMAEREGYILPHCSNCLLWLMLPNYTTREKWTEKALEDFEDTRNKCIESILQIIAEIEAMKKPGFLSSESYHRDYQKKQDELLKHEAHLEFLKTVEWSIEDYREGPVRWNADQATGKMGTASYPGGTT